jgi:hypothetical protein
MEIFRLSAIALLSTCASLPLQAATLLNSSFSADATFENSTNGGNGTADFSGTCSKFDDQSGCDLVTIEGSTPQLLVNWIDQDSFDLQIFLDLQDTQALVSMSFQVFGLNYMLNGLGVDIIGIMLNRGASDLDGYLQSEDNSTGAIFEKPKLSFTANSVSGLFNNYSGQLDGDGPTFRFDILTADNGGGPSPVPLPAGGALLIGGLALLGAMKRNRRA